MTRKNITITILLLVSIVLIASPICLAQGIKERMKERLPQITAMKAAGIVGENSQGFLEFVGDTREKEDVIEAENSDRRKVYEAIAQNQGSTPENVGQRRAMQIAEKAGPGEWLQNSAGEWYQK